MHAGACFRPRQLHGARMAVSNILKSLASLSMGAYFVLARLYGQDVSRLHAMHARGVQTGIAESTPYGQGDESSAAIVICAECDCPCCVSWLGLAP